MKDSQARPANDSTGRNEGQSGRGGARPDYVRWATIGALVLGLAVSLSAGAADHAKPGATYDAEPVLANIANNVIVPIYRDLEDATGALQQSAETLAAEPTAQNVAAARQAWRAARVPWENGEAFLYGPAANEGFDPRLDSWPLDTRALEQVIEDEQHIDQATVGGLDDNLRGYHTVEYLLWSDGGRQARASPAAVAAKLKDNANRRAYLVAVAADMHQTAQALSAAWRPGQSAFAQQMAQAGTAQSDVYPTQRAALQEMVGGMIDIAGETANTKLGEPFEQRAPQLLESSHSFNSRADYSNNMRSVRHIYLGSRTADGQGPGISDFVAAVGGDKLDTRIRTEIDDAVTKVQAIDPPFHDSLDGSQAQRAAIQAAIDVCNQVADTLQNEVMPLVEQTRFQG